MKTCVNCRWSNIDTLKRLVPWFDKRGILRNRELICYRSECSRFPIWEPVEMDHYCGEWLEKEPGAEDIWKKCDELTEYIEK